MNWNREKQSKLNGNGSGILYPLKVIGHKGQDKSATEDLALLLLAKGFSEDMVASIGWILGELSDNSLTHSKDVPCYFMAARYPDEEKYIQIGILDNGIGIQNSLRKNVKHKQLSDKEALLTAFKPFVSSWPDDADRGKGLTDVVNISMSNRSFFKVDSCDLSLFWDFVDLRRSVSFVKPMTNDPGVRFCFILIDDHFDIKTENRKEIEHMIDNKLEENYERN